MGDFVLQKILVKLDKKIQLVVVSDCQSKIAGYKKGSAFNSSNICHMFKVTNFESVFGRSLRGHKRLLDSLED